jgi:hypothetical protein
MSSLELIESIGIDKLILTCKHGDFEVENYSNRDIWGKVSNEYQGGSELPLFSDKTSNPTRATKIYHNAEKFNVNINSFGMQMIFNPSLFYHPTELISAGDKLVDSLNYLKLETQKIGIDCNFEHLKIDRFDYAKNINLSQPLSYYHPALNMLKMSRAKKKETGDTYYLGNKTNQACFYDKGNLILGDKKASMLNGTFARVELRALKNEGASTHFKIGRLIDLVNANPTQLDESYRDFFNKKVFKNQTESTQLMIDFGDEIENFVTLKRNNPKSYFNKWLMLNSIESLFYSFQSLEQIEKFLLCAGEHRINVHRHIAKIRDLVNEFSNIERKSISAVSLLKELKYKIAS